MVALPNVIGIYVRQAGVWERANAGTPEGFSGPQVRQGGVWENIGNGQVYNSGWNYCWTNIDGELNLLDLTASDFDVSPYNVSAWLRFETDGSIDRFNNGSTAFNYDNWREYDCGREYEIYFDYLSGSNIFEEPTLDTWLTFTDGGSSKTIWCTKSGTGFLFSSTVWDVKIREAVSAPAGGNDIGRMIISITAEI